MTQPLTDKIEALKTLLPFLEAYLALLQGAKVVPSYGDAGLLPGTPPPPWAVLDCDGQCPACCWEKECKGEPWERMEAYWRRAYRMDAIAEAYRGLEAYLARAVRLVYVDPYEGRDWAPGMPSSEPISEQARILRRRVADNGVECMARTIRGEIVGLGEKRRPLSEQILELRKKGFSYRAIQRQLGCSSKTIADLCAPSVSADGGPVRCER